MTLLRHANARVAVFGLGLLVSACGDEPAPEPVADPGALIAATLESRVGVLLDEIPDDHRERVANALLAESEEFWTNRARAQVALSSYRLAYRNFFYDEEDGKGQLPLPPSELWELELLGEPERTTLGTHDLVTVDYRLTSTLLTAFESAPEAEPALDAVGGTWDEEFVFPIDPELLLQRTGYACMDEEEFPPNSVDGENVATFYDQECEAAVEEDELENSDCHITEHPDESCVEAVERAVGAVETSIHFERLAWDAALADRVRVGEVTNPDGPDLSVIGAGLENHRIIYRYIEEDSCAIAEGCVDAPGFRRLLLFDASVKNLGAQALDIGEVDYYIEQTETEVGSHNIYVYSECHNHYHFSHYGDFVLETGDGVRGNKQAFCLQSTARYSNNESSPLTHPYGSCDFQGIQAGWGDDYGAGIECQWIDVTNVPASGGEVEAELSFVSNPDRFLCEGEPVLDAEGHLTFEPSEFETTDGNPVDRPVCEFKDDWDANNRESRPVILPADGGLITSPCTRGQIGPLRDCGFAQASSAAGIACAPGEAVTLRCSTEATVPAMIRVCEFSAVLQSGVACVYRDSLGSAVLDGAETLVEFDCPAARSGAEPGGKVSLYVAPLLPADLVVTGSCSVVP